MKSGDLVTVGLKAYNQRAFIREAVEGVLSQTYRPLEIVVSDDGSTDGTWEEIKSVLDGRDLGPDVSFVLNRNAVNLGNMGNWLKIGELSHGEWIVKCDGDDISEANRVETIVKHVVKADENGSKIFVVSNGGIKIDNEGRLIGYFRARSANCQLGATMAFRRDCFTRFPLPINKRIVDDEVFARRALMLGDECLIEEPLVRYRIGSGVSSACENIRATEIHCIQMFPDNLRQCQQDLEFIRTDMGETHYRYWVQRLMNDEVQHSLNLKLCTAKTFVERYQAYRQMAKTSWLTPYRWKLFCYLLPRKWGDGLLKMATRLRYVNRSRFVAGGR